LSYKLTSKHGQQTIASSLNSIVRGAEYTDYITNIIDPVDAFNSGRY
jgi:hypothetical protein